MAEKLSRNAEVVFHKSCISTYTSKHHISRILGKCINTARAKCEPPPPKRRSQSTTFSFKEHCLFCGDICLSRDPKHPNRWREVCQCKTADPALGRKSTKEQILEKCNERGDNLADQVRIRVTGAAADLHAADGQYHKDCFQSFMSQRNVRAVRQRNCQPGIKANDAVFSKLIALIKSDPTHIWSSVEIHQAMLDNLNETDRENALTRKQLFFKVCQELGDQILVIRIEGCANMLDFRSHISEKLCLVKDPDEEISKNLDEICRQMIGEAKKNKKKQEHYDLGQFDVERAINDTSYMEVSK